MAGEPDLVEGHTDDDTNGYVTYLQQTLQYQGHYTDGEVDGSMGTITDAAVRQFQQDNRMTVDGWVGPITWGVLMGEREARITIDLEDFPVLRSVYKAHEQAGSDEVANADAHLTMIDIDPNGIDSDDDTDLA